MHHALAVYDDFQVRLGLSFGDVEFADDIVVLGGCQTALHPALNRISEDQSLLDVSRTQLPAGKPRCYTDRVYICFKILWLLYPTQRESEAGSSNARHQRQKCIQTVVPGALDSLRDKHSYIPTCMLCAIRTSVWRLLIVDDGTARAVKNLKLEEDME